MKIIKYHALDSSKKISNMNIFTIASSINAIAISPNEEFIAFGDSNHQICIYNYQILIQFYSSKSTDSPLLSRDANCYIIDTVSIPKMVLDSLTSEITALHFSNIRQNTLLSSSFDSVITIWSLDSKLFSGDKIGEIPLKHEIYDFVLYPDDTYILAGCSDNNIYVIKTDFDNKTFDIVNVLISHESIISSIVLDPCISTTGRFASLSDKGRLVVTSFNANDNILSVLFNDDDLVNSKHKCEIQRKKIDWSVDGRWIVSVDHHQIKNQSLLHARLIDLNDIDNTQILIGHESPVVAACFSKCIYSTKGYDNYFQLCATSDKNGSLIIWRVENSNFSVVVEIDNYSESSITDMIWSRNGEYLITANSLGLVSAVQFNEFTVKDNTSSLNNMSIFEQNCSLTSNNLTGKEETKQVNYNKLNLINNSSSCLKCQKQLYRTLDNSMNEIPIEGLFTKDKAKVVISWENNPYENTSVIKMKLVSDTETKILFARKLVNKMIKLFTLNNVFYAFYDTSFTLNVFSLLNTMMLAKTYFEEVELLNCYKNYIMVLTSQNRLVIIDVLTQEKIIDDGLNINYLPNNAIQTKIDTIYFISLRQIIIKADSFNPYKATNNKMILYYDTKNKTLFISAYPELSFEEKQIIKNIHLERSFYNNYFEEKVSLKNVNELNLQELYTLSSTVEMFADKLFKARYFQMNSHYMDILKQFIQTIKQINNNTYEYILNDYVLLNHNVVSKEVFDKMKIEIEEKGNVLVGKKEEDDIQNNLPEENDNEMRIEIDSSPNIQTKEL